MSKPIVVNNYEENTEGNKTFISFNMKTHPIMNPKFILKGNSLYVFLHNYNICYLFSNISENAIKNIKTKRARLIENNSEEENTFFINLF